MKRWVLLIVLVFLFWADIGISAENSPQNKEKPSKNEGLQSFPNPLEKIRFQLMQITKRKILIQKELLELEKRIPTKEVVDRIGDLQIEIDKLNGSYEALATQIRVEEYSISQPKEIGWMEELHEITKPILNSLKEITERPRKIENLNTQILTIKNKIQAYNKARENILALEAIKAKVPISIPKDEKGQVTLSEIQNKFQEDLSNLKDRYNPEILSVELEEAERSLKNIQDFDKNLFSLIKETIVNFIQVRGRNLVVAFGFLIGFWWFLIWVFKVIETKTNVLKIVKRPARKFIKAIYLLAVSLMSLVLGFLVLYLFNDWLLLSLLFLVMIAIAWTSRQFVPKFFNELKLILNLGTVREGERIFFEGIPWLVKEIGFHAILHNPRLEGGVLRVPVGKLISASSRQFVKEEEWFPTGMGDRVLLGEDVFGQVVSQTPEQVILKVRESRQVYLTPEFLTLKPRNLSDGFLIVIKFGLDYSVQNRICEEIPQLFQRGLEEHFKTQINQKIPVFRYLKVKFDHAGPSSLDLVILASVNGYYAEEYYSLRRDIHKTLVSVCNAEGFTIPFNQMTLTMSKDFALNEGPNSKDANP